MEVKARALREVKLQPVGDEKTEKRVALLLTDTRPKTNGYIVNPEGLNALLTPLLGLATRWADEPDLAIGTLTGPTNALLATNIALVRGRDASECAMRVQLGKVELTFLLPVDKVVHAMAALAQNVHQPAKH
jgi:hypothetical protein